MKENTENISESESNIILYENDGQYRYEIKAGGLFFCGPNNLEEKIKFIEGMTVNDLKIEIMRKKINDLNEEAVKVILYYTNHNLKIEKNKILIKNNEGDIKKIEDNGPENVFDKDEVEVIEYIQSYFECIDRIKNINTGSWDLLERQYKTDLDFIYDKMTEKCQCVTDKKLIEFEKMREQFNVLYNILKVKNYSDAMELDFENISKKARECLKSTRANEYNEYVKKKKEYDEINLNNTDPLYFKNLELKENNCNEEEKHADFLNKRDNKLSYIKKLIRYIDRVESYKDKSGNIDFTHGFKTFRTMQGKSREANYKTAKILLEELKQITTSLKDVMNKYQFVRCQQAELINKVSPGFFSREKIRGELKSITDSFDKNNNNKIK